MKHIYIPFLFAATLSFAQTHSHGTVTGHDPGRTECLTEDKRSEIKQILAQQIAMLKSQGKLPQTYSPQQVLFDWPLRLRTGVNEYGYHSISGQVDQDPAYPNQLLDYNCGTRTYDTPSGYNHAGTDYFLWPFEWNKMDSMDVEIISCAPGTIIYKSDNNFDRSCGFNSNNWNAVYIQHSDGSVAWYGHMKSGSLTTKNVSQTVAAGEYLGVVGSSGNSTGPHLHLEIYDSGNNLIDPYQGTCNSLNTSSWWNNQRPYIDRAINHIATNFTPPVFTACPNQSIKNERDYFTNTDTIFLMTYYRFLMNNDSVRINIYRPNSTVWGSWGWNNSWGDFNAAYVYWWMIAGSSEPNGQWTFEAVYDNQVYQHNFWLGPTGVTHEDQQTQVMLFPNPNAGTFTVVCGENFTGTDMELKLYDVLGKEVLTRKMISSRTEIQQNELSPGVYLYAVYKQGRQAGFGKLVVKN
jgi:hypothetical protein